MRLIDANELLSKMHRLDEKQKTDVWLTCDIEVLLEMQPTVDAVEAVHAEWDVIENDHAFDTIYRCSACKEEALSTTWDEPIYDYDWEENLHYSCTETHTEYHLTDYCPNCGADMRERKDNERKAD